MPRISLLDNIPEVEDSVALKELSIDRLGEWLSILGHVLNLF
jgi:hypothetical protein